MSVDFNQGAKDAGMGLHPKPGATPAYNDGYKSQSK
jgi:hypothetical protein